MKATQALAFPRKGSTAVPRAVHLAVCRLIGQMADGATLYTAPQTLGGQKRVKAGSVEVENFEVTSEERAKVATTDYLWLQDALREFIQTSRMTGLAVSRRK